MIALFSLLQYSLNSTDADKVGAGTGGRHATPGNAPSRPCPEDEDLVGQRWLNVAAAEAKKAATAANCANSAAPASTASSRKYF